MPICDGRKQQTNNLTGTPVHLIYWRRRLYGIKIYIDPIGMSFLQKTPAAYVRRPRHVAALRELRQPRAAQSDGAVLSASCLCLRSLLAGAVAGVCQPG